VDNSLLSRSIQSTDGSYYRSPSRFKLTGEDKPFRLSYFGLNQATNRPVSQSSFFSYSHLFCG